VRRIRVVRAEAGVALGNFMGAFLGLEPGTKLAFSAESTRGGVKHPLLTLGRCEILQDLTPAGFRSPGNG